MVAVIDYGVANCASVLNAFRYAGFDAQVACSPEDVLSAGKLVLPGVGAFGAAMDRLETSGLADAVRTAVGEGAPVLGICLGMQLLFEASDEAPGTPGIGLLPGRFRAFAGDSMQGGFATHMGYSAVTAARQSRLFSDIPVGYDFYFVHSYYLPTGTVEGEASAEFRGTRFTAAFETSAGVFGTQFHPERSQGNGLALICNFMAT